MSGSDHTSNCIKYSFRGYKAIQKEYNRISEKLSYELKKLAVGAKYNASATKIVKI